MDSALLLLRVVLALACVLGLLWFVARRAGGRRAAAARRAPTLALVGRQSLGGRSAVALVEVAGRRLVLGVGEHGVTLLTEVGPEPEPTGDDRVCLDTAELERLLALESPDDTADLTDLAELTEPADGADLRRRALSTAVPDAALSTAAPGAAVAASRATPHPVPSSPAARKPAVPTPRNPLEGSILDATTWRRAVEAVQERTLRR